MQPTGRGPMAGYRSADAWGPANWRPESASTPANFHVLQRKNPHIARRLGQSQKNRRRIRTMSLPAQFSGACNIGSFLASLSYQSVFLGRGL